MYSRKKGRRYLTKKKQDLIKINIVSMVLTKVSARFDLKLTCMTELG